MLKKIFLLFFISFLLFSCGEDDKSDGLVNYSASGFTLRIPKKWEKLENDTSILPKPSSGDLELVTTSKTSSGEFYNSFVILSEDLEKNISSSDYSSSNNLVQKKNFYDYKELSADSISFGEGENADRSIVYVFDVKYNKNIKRLRFLQTGVVCDKKGYILTLVIPTTIDDILKYEYIFSTFRCK